MNISMIECYNEVFTRKMVMILKGLTIGLLFIGLSGCASIIANEITNAKYPYVAGDVSDLTVEKRICDSNHNCIKTIGLANTEATHVSLSFDFKINENRKVWSYQTQNDNIENVKPLANQLILIFAGYSQPAEILYIHQQWLQHITGADVIVIPSADNSDKFQFGLNYTSPLVAEIKRSQPTKVHLVGFSMGALAAQAIEQEIDDARLYLFAPMTDFEYSTKAIYETQYKNKFYAKFISPEILGDAIKIVYEKSGTTSRDTDLLVKLDRVSSPTFIYSSSADKVTDSSVLKSVQNKNVDVNIYKDLNHIEMVALFSQDLLVEFVSNLLDRPVSKSEVTTLGVLCDFDDNDCLNELQN